MSPKQHKAREIFIQIENLSAAERQQFIDEHLANDSELRAAIEDLIADKYETKAYRSFIGSQLGAYKIISELGRGGMGMVFLATRIDGEFRQQVAVKLIKRGMDTEYILKRFRQERQITATLDHPNIAKLFNGGTTSDDLPYFVMEYVNGSSLVDYASEQKLNRREKLELFLQICEAIIYAHEQRVIHRDLKPSNILVTNAGVPKLLDFGIAKILDPALIHESIAPTATQMHLMTPEYASPEQIKGEEITEASDQYSLGVILYELISGNRPYKFSSRAAHDITRVICEEMPAEFADKITVSASSDDLLNDSESREKLDRLVLKTLAKNSAERYASVQHFADDIARFLRNEPILAQNSRKAADPSPKKAYAVTLKSQKSIAVLPLKSFNATAGERNQSGDYLKIGLVDALITKLSNVRDFVVRPTSSVLHYADSTAEPFVAGRALKVAFVIDGSLLIAGDKIRVSVQLLDVARESVVWAERFDEDWADVFALEDSISKKVVESLVPQLSPDEKRQLAKRGTDNVAAYEAYLRGRYYWNSFSEDGFRQAFSYYQKAVALDPDYALAHTAIAEYYIWFGIYNLVPTQDCYPPAKIAALKAIELDEELAEAHCALGAARLFGDYDWQKSERDVLRAIELSPHNPVAYLWYSLAFLTQGRAEEGLRYSRRAVELDPLSFLSYNTLAYGYFFMRRYDEALVKVEEVIQRFPTISHAHMSKAVFLNRLGRTDEAMTAMQRSLELSTDSIYSYYGIALTYGAAGMRREAVELLEKTADEAKTKGNYFSNYQVASVYSYLNDRDKTFEHLNQAYQNRESMLVWSGVDPAFDAMRDDPRYIQLLRKISHPALQTVYSEQIKRHTSSSDSSEDNADSASGMSSQEKFDKPPAAYNNFREKTETTAPIMTDSLAKSADIRLLAKVLLAIITLLAFVGFGAYYLFR